MAFDYESLPTEIEDDKEKSLLATTSAQSNPEHHERMHKTIFAACVFVVFWTGVLITLSSMEPEEGLWSSRQALIPNSQSYEDPLFFASLSKCQ